MNEHLDEHYAFYGEFMGVRTARKHIGWYVRDLAGGEAFRQRMNRLETTATSSWPPSTHFSNRSRLWRAVTIRPRRADEDVAALIKPGRDKLRGSTQID